MYLDFAEMQAKKHIAMNMQDWIKKLDAFLKFNEEKILNHIGKVSHNVAIELAEKEFEEFKQISEKNYLSDFDKQLKKIKK